jgi:hypothetical protein
MNYLYELSTVLGFSLILSLEWNSVTKLHSEAWLYIDLPIIVNPLVLSSILTKNIKS